MFSPQKMRYLLSRLGGQSLAASLFSWPVLLVSIVISTLVIGVRQLEVLEDLELDSYDQMVRLRPDEGADPRLLVVEVTEADIQELGQWPTSDQTLERLFERLEQHQPRVIGLDIYRPLRMDPGHAELATSLQLNDNIIAVCKASNSGAPGVPPPPTVPESRLGFSDIVVDPSGIVRRNLMFITPEPNSTCSTAHSFGLQLALHYLEKEGIQPKLTEQEYLQLGSTIFKPIKENTVGYQNIDARGYQVLLNYRSPSNVARHVTLQEVLAGRINPSWVKDHVVLIGVTAPSINDYFYTPYSRDRHQDLRMPGVLLHAQMTSQILSAVLDNRALIWFWPGWIEVPWVWVWSLVGGGLAWRIRHPLLLGLAGGAALGGLVGICYAIFTQQGWVPLVPPALALVASGTLVICYKQYLATPKQKRFSGVPQIEDDIPTEFQGSRKRDTPQEDAGPLLVGRGRYKIIEKIGEGGFGQTYRAEDTLLPGRPHCVVKQLVPASKDEEFVELAKRLFQREAETLEQLGRHDQIPQLLAYFEEYREFYLVQEFIKGSPLSDELSPGKRLRESQVVDLLKDVLGILDFVHSHGFIHRDIKPANIMRRKSDGRLVLIDFGAVKTAELQRQTQVVEKQENPYTIAIGTKIYAAPEQLEGQPVFSSDIYALGIIGIQAVTGKKFLVKPMKDVITQEIIGQDDAQVSDELAAILDKMVRYYPSERYESAAEVLQAFEHFGL